ncbi:MAG: hypothetical protein D6712_08980 [Chloroflexi bacterium]|nr:MAG: hypothetical protein D6712_08980 [Chloroflexota bacterium]
MLLPSPFFVFGFVLATLIGALFHLFVGGDARKLALYLLAAWLGFGIGHLFGVMFDINMLNIGPLRVFAAIVGAIIALLIAYLFTTSRARRRTL